MRDYRVDMRDYRVDNRGYICTAICCTGARHLFSSSNLAMKLYIACMREDSQHYLINLISVRVQIPASSFQSRTLEGLRTELVTYK